MLKSSGKLVVAGFVKTKYFQLWLGDGQNAVGELKYKLSENEKEFELRIVSSDKNIGGMLSVDVSDISGSKIMTKLNGQTNTNLIVSDDCLCLSLKHGDKLILTTFSPSREGNITASS